MEHMASKRKRSPSGAYYHYHRDMAAEREKSSSSGTKYQVFLSFRGPDTRQGFTDVLYHALLDQGIRVFRDDEEIRKGEDISDEILSAIQDSSIFVPIFSRNYASSKWCLRELTKMFDSMESSTSDSNKKKKILPIFYDVTVADVKLKTQLYKGALSAHRRTSVPAEIVEKWKVVLREAGKIEGWELKNTGYAEFAKKFVGDVSIMLKAKHKSLNEHFIRRDDQEDELLNLLHVELYGARIVGIHGMGGIGKTTLAKVVYNRLCDGFEHCSFLSDIRESSLQHKGIEHLQNKLLADLGLKSGKITDVVDGIAKIKEVVATKKVLIVLDDIDHIEQIRSLAGDARWFGSGSRIVITSRYKSVLQTGRVHLFEVKEMKSEDALRLLSMHAFDNDSPPAHYHSVSKEAVASTGGLPLALEVIGSYLRDKKLEIWVKTTERLKKAPHRDVQKKLMISYESLDQNTKHIFLDIACFFINKDRTNPTYMWEARGFDPDKGVEELVNLSLVKIITIKNSHGDMEERLWMHDQLRDLGRNIVENENPGVDIKSRLWRSKNVSKALENLEDDEDDRKKIEMIRIRSKSGSRYTLPTKEISSLKNLRYLECSKACFSGGGRLHLRKLLWLAWRYCPLDFTGTDLHFSNLVILDISNSSISETWDGWSDNKIGKKLRVLDLSWCERLTKMPDFSKYSSLERLILVGCSNLTDLDPSIGKLQGLKLLDIRSCDSLRGFPEELCSMGSLEVILGDCDFSKEKRCFNMPESFGNLRSLSVFKLKHIQINKLPKSISKLVGLRHLSLKGCKGLQGLPDLLGDIVSLVELDLSYTDVDALPQSIGRLEKLELLNLSGCRKLKMLPNSVGHLRSLVELNLSGSGIKEMPSTIKLLPNLSTLSILDTRITGLPPKFPTNVTKLYVRTLLRDDQKPEGIGECKKLVDLELSDSMRTLPKSLDSLSQLQRLTLSYYVKDDEIFGNMEIRQLEYLREFRLSFFDHRNLNLVFLPECLMELEISGSDYLETIKGISHLKSLKKLKLEWCSKLVKIREVGELDSLESITIRGCNSLETISNLKELNNLRDIQIQGCTKLKDKDIYELKYQTYYQS